MTTLPSILLRARLQLMLRHPYLATAVVQLPFCDATQFGWCRTMATDGHHIFFNRRFCEQLSEVETTFVITHELLHVVLGHRDRKGDRDHGRWNVAADYAINIMLSDLGFEMPAEGLISTDFRGMTAEQIYDGMSAHDAKRFAPERFNEAAVANGGLDGNAVPSERGWRSFDGHLDPDDPRIQAVEGVEPVSAQERAIIRVRLVRDIKSRQAGRFPGTFMEEIKAAAEAEVPWTVLLSRFVDGIRRDDYRLFPFNRKHLWRGLYLPAMGVPGPEHLIIAVDTSVSMGHDELGRVMAELDVLRSQTECLLTVVQFDVDIQRVDRFEAWEPVVPGQSTGSDGGRGGRWHGRGGTDIRAPFSWLNRQETEEADAIIVMTDGYGSMPEHEPRIPTLWIAMPESNVEFPFGSVIRLRNP